jgi:prepilin-type N-terminal cleavage/methylation domain-containing protein/prepilin-type processing-associated H-X9-DG protein
MDVPTVNLFRKPGRRAFTLIELMVVLAVTTILCALFVNGLRAQTRARVQSIQCMNNHKRLMAAALIYADEFNGLWFPNEPAGEGNQTDWVPAYTDWNANNTHNTNINELAIPATSLLAPYLGRGPKVFHCPSDQSYVINEGFRVRSVSANIAVGTVWVAIGCLVPNAPVNGQWLTGANIGSSCQTWRCYGKSSDFTLPGPALTFVFTDEHCDSINDSVLSVQCAQQGIGASFIDRPANYHNGAATFSFADGHVEIHKWSGPTLGAGPDYWEGPLTGGYVVTSSADNSDLIWLQQRTSAHP